jgi:hypothetical protein
MRYGILVILAATFFAACDGLGTPCRDRGSKGECGPGEICARVDGDNYCQPICDDDGDCAPDESCGGVKDSKDKACRPDDAPYDDDDFDGPPY